jgi:signal transduction histidine kinase
MEFEVVKAKEKAEESDRLKSFTNMSHEFNSYERYFGIFILVGAWINNEEQQEYIKLIQISGARMLNLISEIIDISKLNPE